MPFVSQGDCTTTDLKLDPSYLGGLLGGYKQRKLIKGKWSNCCR